MAASAIYRKERFAKAAFLPVSHVNTVVIHDTVKGTYQAMPITLTDVTTDYKTPTAKNKAGVDYLAGCYLELKLSKKPALDFVILSEGSIPASIFEKRCASLNRISLHTSGKKEHQFRLYLPMVRLSPSFRRNW